MPIDPTQRIAKWNTKYDVTRIAEILTGLRERMYTNVQAVFPLIVAMETQVKQVLDLEGVSIITYPFYLDFGREMWRLQRMEVSGESLAVESATLIGKWVSRGLASGVLETIRTQVFNIGAPTP